MHKPICLLCFTVGSAVKSTKQHKVGPTKTERAQLPMRNELLSLDIHLRL